MNVLGSLLAGLLSFTLFATPALQSSKADDATNQKLLLNLIAGTSSNGKLSAGFDSAIVGMKPLDTQTRFVDYSNSGMLNLPLQPWVLLHTHLQARVAQLLLRHLLMQF